MYHAHVNDSRPLELKYHGWLLIFLEFCDAARHRNLDNGGAAVRRIAVGTSAISFMRQQICFINAIIHTNVNFKTYY